MSDLDADAARQTCDEIEGACSEAIWDRTNVQELKEAEEMVSKAIGRWEQAHIPGEQCRHWRDRTFAKADLAAIAVAGVRIVCGGDCAGKVYVIET